MNNFIAIAVSIIVVALTIYAVALFITSGASGYFYIVVAIALAIGLVNSWLISSGRYERRKESVENKETISSAPSSVAAEATVNLDGKSRPKAKRRSRKTSKK